MVSQVMEKTDADLFDEWKELFTKYRSYGKLPKDERKKFRKLSSEMRKRGIISELSLRSIVDSVTGSNLSEREGEI